MRLSITCRMDALELIIFLAGIAASLVVATGFLVCLVVWLAGQGNERATEVCPPAGKS